MAITLAAGDAAPHFELLDQDGNTHRLKDYLGKTVVLSELENVAASNSYLVLSEDATTGGLHERTIEKARAATEHGADWISRHAFAVTRSRH